MSIDKYEELISQRSLFLSQNSLHQREQLIVANAKIEESYRSQAKLTLYLTIIAVGLVATTVLATSYNCKKTADLLKGINKVGVTSFKEMYNSNNQADITKWQSIAGNIKTDEHQIEEEANRAKEYWKQRMEHIKTMQQLAQNIANAL